MRPGFLGRWSASVRFKVMFVVLATTFVALLVTAIALVTYEASTYRNAWIEDLQGQASLLGRSSSPALEFNDPKTARDNLQMLRVRPQIFVAALYTPDGTLFASFRQSGHEADAIPSGAEAPGVVINGGEIAITEPIFDHGERTALVYMRARYQLADRVRDYLGIVGTILGVSLLIAALMALWLQRTLTLPLRSITDVAQQVVGRRDFSLRAKKTTEDEIGYLVDAFNDMLHEIGARSEALLAADRRKDEFLATLAHELRNPLAPMKSGLELLRLVRQRAGPDSAALSIRAEGMVERQLQQMVRLVDDLLDVSRITTGKLALKTELTTLQAIITAAVDSVSPFLRTREQRLDVHMPDADIPVQADRTRLVQIIGNLLNNAAKYMDPGGTITLDAGTQDGQVLIAISDKGIGLEPEMLTRIFEMFEQVDRSLERSHAGLGVGLTLAKRLAELHGGSLEARSEGVGKGSTFIVRLPILCPASEVQSNVAPKSLRDLTSALPGTNAGTGQETAVPPPARAELQASASGGQTSGLDRKVDRALVAEDNPDTAEAFAALLRERGLEVRVAHDGEAALVLAAEFLPKFVFLDIGLPKANGYEVARQLRAQPFGRDCVVTAITGWGQEKDRLMSRLSGFDFHLVKPVDMQDVAVILAAGNSEQSARQVLAEAYANARTQTSTEVS